MVSWYEEHENGQLRVGVAGEQVSLLPLPASEIPESDGPALSAPSLEELAGRYAVKCDHCKTEIRRTDSVGESAAGGYCDECRRDPAVVGRTRARLERRAGQLREWAGKRERDAGAVLKSHEVYRGDHAFNFQPGHIPERARVIAQADRAFESLDKARSMSSRAGGIEAQLRASVYDDDPDAVEQLRAKVARLEEKRAAIKARPHAGYELSNPGATIRNAKQRIERLERERATVEAGGRGRGRAMLARFSSSCADCGEQIEKGSPITYYRLTREAVHAGHEEA